MNSDDISPWLARGLYLFGLSFVLTAGIDLFTTVWPMRPTEIAWRYGFLGLGAGYLQTPTLGLLLIILAGIWENNVRLLRAAGIFCLGVALCLFLAMGIFGLDVIQMRQLRAEEAQASVLLGGFFQEVKYFVAAFVLAFLGHGALKTAKTARLQTPDVKNERPGIVSSGS